MAELAKEQARAQAWEMLLEKAREAHQADPKAAAAAKTLLGDPTWKQIIQAEVTASPEPEPTQGDAPEKLATGAAVDGVPPGYEQVPWRVVYPGYIDGQLAFGVPFDEVMTEKEGTLVIENIGWGSAA
jgi:hypothetical protein